MAVADGQGGVLVGEVLVVSGDEAVPLDAFHRLEHAVVDNPAAPDLLLDHGTSGFDERVAVQRGSCLLR